MVVEFSIIRSCSSEYYLKTDFLLPLLQFQASLEHELGLLTGWMVEIELYVRPGTAQFHLYPGHHAQLQQTLGL